MASIPKAEVEVAIKAKMAKSLSMKILRWLWIVLAVFMFAMAFISVYIIPESMPRFMQITPFLTGLITLMGCVAFGGSAIKRNAILKNG